MTANEIAIALWGRIKGMGSTLALVGTAILLALAGIRAAKRRARVARNESLLLDVQMRRIGTELIHVGELAERINLDQQKTHAAKAALKKNLEKLANANQDINAAAHAFDSERVRIKPD